MRREDLDIAFGFLIDLRGVALNFMFDARQAIPDVVVGIAIGNAELKAFQPFFANGAAFVFGQRNNIFAEQCPVFAELKAEPQGVQQTIGVGAATQFDAARAFPKRVSGIFDTKCT